MSRLFSALAVILTLAYPFLVYFGLQQFDPRLLVPLMLLILALRWLGGRSVLERGIQAAVAGVLVALVFVFDNPIGLKFYPVLVNAGFLVLFAGSLFRPPTVIERLARLQEPELSTGAVRYTRKVTIVWCLFFMGNGLTAAGTALFATDQIWMLYNGLIAYLLMATLFTGEWLVRRHVRRKDDEQINSTV